MSCFSDYWGLFVFIKSNCKREYNVFVTENTVYLSVRIQCIYRREYSVFTGENTVYLSARIQCIYRREYSVFIWSVLPWLIVRQKCSFVIIISITLNSVTSVRRKLHSSCWVHKLFTFFSKFLRQKSMFFTIKSWNLNILKNSCKSATTNYHYYQPAPPTIFWLPGTITN